MRFKICGKNIMLTTHIIIAIIVDNIIPLITGQALVLVQTDAGIINNTINLPDKISEENCKDASKFLTTNLYNKPICDIISNFDYYNSLFKNQIKYFQEFDEYCNQLYSNLEELVSKAVCTLDGEVIIRDNFHQYNLCKYVGVA